MFLHTSVILSTGGVYPSMYLDRHPRGQIPPLPADTPLGSYPQAHTPQADSPSHQAATEANGTHPTWIHSCYCKNFIRVPVVCYSYKNNTSILCWYINYRTDCVDIADGILCAWWMPVFSAEVHVCTRHWIKLWMNIYVLILQYLANLNKGQKH